MTERDVRSARGFSLIDVFLTLAVLAILAAVVVPRYEDKSEQARRACIHTQLDIIRRQIEVHDAKHPGEPFAPLHPQPSPSRHGMARKNQPAGVDALRAKDAAKANQWRQLTEGGYLSVEPANPLQRDSTRIARAPGDGVGWVYADPTGLGATIYAVDADGRYFDDDDDGVPD